MLTLTEAASTKLKEIMGREPEPVFGVRVSAGEGRCSCNPFTMSLAPAAEAGEWVGEFGGVRVVVDPESAPSLPGVVVDYVEKPGASGFTISNPGAARGCGCGTKAEAGETTAGTRGERGSCGCGGDRPTEGEA